MNSPANKFLTAEWRHLAMLNYEIEPAALAPFVPAGTELDSWNGRTFVSMVGFLFLRKRVFGVPIPFHQDFEEVNLRLYVRRQASEGWRRGVVFVKEIVPRAAIAWLARQVYNEPYIAVPMRHEIASEAGVVKAAEYGWRFSGRENRLAVVTQGPAKSLVPGAAAEFITEHYWGYNRQRNGTTMEYRVEHPPWRVYDVTTTTLDCDVVGLYGERFRASLAGQPASAFLAEGSEVTVYRGVRLAT
jgi:uncharacterized protein YqjF (DUF2071 family)